MYAFSSVEKIYEIPYIEKEFRIPTNKFGSLERLQ